MQLKDLINFDDLSRYTQSPVIFNQQKENSMSNFTLDNTINKSKVDFEAEFLLIFRKFTTLEKKLDLIVEALNPDPIDLLSESEKELMDRIVPYK